MKDLIQANCLWRAHTSKKFLGVCLRVGHKIRLLSSALAEKILQDFDLSIATKTLWDRVVPQHHLNLWITKLQCDRSRYERLNEWYPPLCRPLPNMLFLELFTVYHHKTYPSLAHCSIIWQLMPTPNSHGGTPTLLTFQDQGVNTILQTPSDLNMNPNLNLNSSHKRKNHLGWNCRTYPSQTTICQNLVDPLDFFFH